MMLKTSSNKLNPAVKLFSFTLRKSMGLILLASVAMLLVCPGYLFIHLNERLANSNDIYKLDSIITIMITLITIAACCGVIVLNVINFVYLYSKKSSDVFHAIPVTRTELLLSRVMAGFTSVMIPVVLGYGSLLVLTAFMPRVTGNLATIAIGFLYTVMAALVSSAFSMIFIICAGTAFDLVLSFAGVNLGLILAAAIIEAMCSEHLIGYAAMLSNEIYAVLSPFWFIGEALTKFLVTAPEFTFTNAIFFFRAAVYVAVFIMFTVWLYNRRRAEKSGDAYAYRFIYVLCAFLVSFAAAFGMGQIFANGKYNVIFWVFAVCGALLIAITFGAITNRGFKTVKQSAVIGLSSVAAMAIVVTVLQFGLFGYSERIPQSGDVKSVTVELQNQSIKFDSPDKVIALHKSITSNLAALKNRSDIYDGSWMHFTLTYKLKNGHEMRRYYIVPIDTFSEPLLEVYKSKERLQGLYEMLNEDNPRYININGQYSKEEVGSVSASITRRELQQILDAYTKDLSKATTDVFFGRSTQSYQIEWQGQDDAYRWFELVVEKQFFTTQAVLDSLNLEERVPEYEQYKQ